MQIVPSPPIAELRKMLDEAGLPSSDLNAAHLKNFFGARVNSRLVGAVGLELFGGDVLLRSLVVDAQFRKSGIGSKLVERAESYAAENGGRSIYLLTTTAESYFCKRGYSPLAKELAPKAVRESSEFAELCPESSILMVKHLTGSPGNSGKEQ